MGASYTWTFMVALLVIQKIHNFSWLGLCLQGGGNFKKVVANEKSCKVSVGELILVR